MQKRFVSEKEIEASKLVAQSATDALWHKVRHGGTDSSDGLNSETGASIIDTRPLHERLAENQAKTAAKREEEFLASAFQAPRIYSDEEYQFLVEKEQEQRIKEKQLEQEVNQFNSIASEKRTIYHSETDSTLKLISKRKKSQDTPLFARSIPSHSGASPSSPPTSKKRPPTDAVEDIFPDLIDQKKHKSVVDEEAEEEAGSLAALVGYASD